MTSALITAPRTVTLGCRLNAFESEVMRGHAIAAGLDDAIIVNTCTVTAEADRQARQTIRRLRRDNPGARIIVTGCAAEMDRDGFAAMDAVDHVIGNHDKLDPAAFQARRLDGAGEVVAEPRTAPLIDGFDGRSRAFVQVQQGCDHQCTFCIIPDARGGNRSIDADAIVAQVRRLVDNGYREVVLTGVDICSWGHDLAGRPSLGQLTEGILDAVTDLERLRLSTIDPAAVDDHLVRLFADTPRLMPHVHLSLQAADDMVLKRMRRRHDRAQAADLCRRLREARPDIVLGADLIAGFPTENEAMFANTLEAIDELGLDLLHVFPYSPRPGTPAARMPQVPPKERKRRAAVLRAAGARRLLARLASRVGEQAQVLVEGDRRGRSEDYLAVRLSASTAPGSVVAARITGAGDDHLVATPTP
jgi:threonylcarbamoyladenosine tRNA methylthiotransferase MtaB